MLRLILQCSKIKTPRNHGLFVSAAPLGEADLRAEADATETWT